MTLLDFFRLLGRYIVIVIGLPILLAAACMGYIAISHSGDATYTAESRIIVSTHAGDVNGLAAAQARSHTDATQGIEVKTTLESNTKSVVITVVAPDEDQSIELANEIADTVLKESFEFVPENAEDPYNARIEPAIEAEENAATGAIKYLVVAILAGLFFAMCIVVIIDMVKRPVKSIKGVQDAIELPVLEELPITDGGERLLANARFASKKDDLKSICLVPVGSQTALGAIAKALENAAKAESPQADVQVVCHESLSKSMKAAYEARNADATLLVVTQWDDSLAALESAAAELKLADANLVGVVFANRQSGRKQ